jgi:bacterioferritin-associated ferredoxin
MTDDDLLICRCEEVSKKDILWAIEHGADSVDEIKRITRAGMGLCQGQTCRCLVARILAEETSLKASDVLPGSCRPPVRLIPVSILRHAEPPLEFGTGSSDESSKKQ